MTKMFIPSRVSVHYCYFALTSQLLHDMDLSVAFILMGAISSISNLFIYSYYGELATGSFENMSECLYYDLNWLNLPTNVQKYVVVMIAKMQKPVYYHGFEFAVLDLRTFIQVKS